MASPQAQDISPRMRPTKGSAGGTGKAGRPFGRTRKKAGTARKPARKAGARKGAGGRARGRGRAAKKR